MHRIVVDTAIKQLPMAQSDIENLLANTTAELHIDQAKDNPVDKFQWVPFGHAILHTFSDIETGEFSNLQNNLATVLKDLGDYEGAKALLQKAVASDEKNFGVDHPSTAISYSNLALVLQDLGELETALSYSGKSVAIFEQALPAGHPNIATVRGIYAGIKAEMEGS